MFRSIMIGTLVLAVVSINANAHMGRYPCDFDEAFVSKIRKLSKVEYPKNDDLRAALDLIVDAAEHCREEELIEVMKELMERGVVEEEKEKPTNVSPDPSLHCYVLGDGETTTWECSSDTMPESTKCPSRRYEMSGTTTWTCPNDINSPWD